jgi:hypothetical protein
MPEKWLLISEQEFDGVLVQLVIEQDQVDAVRENATPMIRTAPTVLITVA